MAGCSQTPAILFLIMPKVLLQFAHPALEKSRVHKHLLASAKGLAGVTINDLYELYPDFDIDIEREQALLMKHDVIILQHPFYWYSAPAIIKQWLDLVLEHGWAYGQKGKVLAGKILAQCISSGGSANSYSTDGKNKRSMDEYLYPFSQTAALCSMQYSPPFVVFGTHKISPDHMLTCSTHYQNWIMQMVNSHQSATSKLHT